jgi:F-type H+-transporting ATPase subunit b
MPHLDISSFPSQIFWLIVSVLTMYFIMNTFIVPKIAKTIDERNDKIDGNIQIAEDFKNQAENIRNEYEIKLAEAKKTGQLKIEESNKELENFITQKENEFNKKFNAKLKESEEKIKSQKEEILSDLENLSTNISDNIIEKFGIENISNDNINKEVKNIINK